MKRATKIIGSAIVVGVGLLANRILKPDETSLVEKRLDGTYKLYSVPTSRLEPIEIVGGQLEVDEDDVAHAYHYDVEDNTIYVTPDDLHSEGDSR